MADNTTLNVGSGGDVIASDDIGGVKYQRVKLTLGVDGVTNGDVSSTNPVPIEFPQATGTSRSGTTSATVSTSTVLMAANTSRNGWLIRNTHASASVWINELGVAAVAAQPSLEIKAGELFICPTNYVVTTGINIISTTASVPYTAREW